jgi:hypothetical protein
VTLPARLLQDRLESLVRDQLAFGKGGRLFLFRFLLNTQFDGEGRRIKARKTPVYAVTAAV